MKESTKLTIQERRKKSYTLIEGFTLIELMIVIAIVGILATLAVPTYQNYMVRSRVSEALNFAETAKTAVSETMMTNGGEAPATNEDAGFQFTAPTDNVQNVMIGENGVITITTTDDAGDGTFSMTPNYKDGQVTWTCHRGSLAARYLPQNCRTEE